MRTVLLRVPGISMLAALLGAAVVISALFGCSPTVETEVPESIPAEPAGPAAGAPPWRFVEKGDLPELRRRGVLRLVSLRQPELGYLPRGDGAHLSHRELLEAFGRDFGVELVWIPVDSRADQMRLVLEGKGDLTAGYHGPAVETPPGIALSVPVRRVQAQIVVRGADADSISSLDELRGRRISYIASSPFAHVALRIAEQNPKITLEAAPDRAVPLELLDMVAEGSADAALVSSRWVEVAQEYGADIGVVISLEDSLALAGAMRADSSELRRAVDQFVIDAHAAGLRDERTRDDLPRIRERRILRVLTENTGASYFVHRGQARGFDYELADRFAEQQGLTTRVVVVPEHDDLTRWLLDGKGDLVAAPLAESDAGPDELSLGRPCRFASAVVVGARDENPVAGIEELAGRSIVLPSDSIHWPKAHELSHKHRDLTFLPAEAGVDATRLVNAVRRGDVPLALLDSDAVRDVLEEDDALVSVWQIRESAPFHWATRADQPELRKELDAFLRREYRGTVYNVLHKRYFSRAARGVQERALRAEGDPLSPYDELVKRVADQHDFDWRLIVAQMYQESRFDPGVVSHAGAVGLMQILPRTAAEFGFHELEKPEVAVHAAVVYLAWLRDRFDPDLPLAERMAFTVAAYNAGYGHVSDARLIARRNGLDPDRWFGNVENAMLTLSRRDVARTVPHGYCRGSEPVRYVREILERFQTYVRATDR